MCVVLTQAPSPSKDQFELVVVSVVRRLYMFLFFIFHFVYKYITCMYIPEDKFGCCSLNAAYLFFFFLDIGSLTAVE